MVRNGMCALVRELQWKGGTSGKVAAYAGKGRPTRESGDTVVSSKAYGALPWLTITPFYRNDYVFLSELS